MVLSALLIFAATPQMALAHTKSETQSIWRVIGNTVHVAYTIPEIELPRLSHPDGTLPSEAEIANYVRTNVNVLEDGQPCERSEDVRPVAASQGFRRFEFAYKCADAERMAIHSSAFFPVVPTHVTYAQIVTDKGEFISQILDAGNETLSLSSASGESPLQNASFFTYVGMGIMHIFTGYDHQAFLLGLVLLSRRLRDLIFVVTGFTIGHSISLSLAVTGILRPHAEYIDSLVGLTIALIAAENIADTAHRRGTIALAFGGIMLVFALLSFAGLKGLPFYLVVGAAVFASNYMMMAGFIRDAAQMRLVVTLIFGTIHGFSFANNLLEMKLPTGRLAELLVGFNLGVEIGQLAVVAVLLSGLAILSRLKWTLPRPITVDVLSGILVALGLYWFVTRGYTIA
ncbi:MAG TPA: HupE/UreJ family protein [Micropepsaceae bacterium]|nr:HupE/UreJ family protein [Micropepsaceae bacterium]